MRWKGYSLKKEFSLKQKKITCEDASQNLMKSCLSFGGGLEGSNKEKKKKKMGRQQKKFCSEVWENCLKGLVKILWDPPCVTVLWKLSLSKGEFPLRGEVGWDRITYWLQRLLLPLRSS